MEVHGANRRSLKHKVLMAIVFDEILTKGVRGGQIPARTQSARNWFRDTARAISRINERQLMRGDTSRLQTRPIVGNMYMFYYDPKYKEELPYYDRFPLIYPYKRVPGGFMGINMHYLPLQLRAKLMDGLYDYVNNTRYDESTKLKMSYNVLSNAARLRYFEPCVKHYLSDHVVSKFLYIYPSEWDIALFLPTERFTKKSKTQVWAESKKMIGAR